MSKLDKEQVIEKFTEAYKSAHGKAPTIEAKGGWYSVDGGKNVRLSALEEMITELESSDSKVEPVENKTAKQQKQPAAKAKATKKAKSKSSFSVKQYWQDQIMAQNPGSKLPR
ncbi:hypothetical protein Q4567_15995 [Aliiglaciecola sp. 2_MG-2023]|uniref:hypothetical protein n=1 Tax=Alteromonadaceae TaxID=72275 RepID=UPI0026E280A7|nr:MULTISPECIES: hypothetical protein [unclassified Aliiglaciecola]MDO6712238.1 hypothetical protein [Aliiglaciecola sp. 2_MG-2023]MDO6753524.1 hypothetical protein [Aliiglaciecola sp. 1_MG-2023]